MKSSNSIKKLDKDILDFKDMKRLKEKHFIRKDRNYLFDHINSFEKKLGRLLKVNLVESKKNVFKLKNSKKEVEKISKFVDELIVEMNKELRLLERQRELVHEQKKRLLNKGKSLDKKISKIREDLSIKSKRVTSLRNKKVKL